MLSKTVDIKHTCGHTERKRICGYASLPGSMESQIQRKISYYSGIACPECMYKQEV